MGTTETQPILIRAALTQDEWAALRKLALDKRVPVKELVASALRSAPVTRKAFQTKEPRT